MDISYIFEDDFCPYLDLFLRHCPPPLNMPKGAIICKKGYTNGWMYYLLGGTVKICTVNYNGYARIIAYMKKHTIFALDCVNGKDMSTVNIESVSDIQVLPFTVEILKRIMARNGEFAFDFVCYYSKIVRQLTFDAENQSINDAATRLVNFFYTYMSTPGYAENKKIDMTQESLAAAINSSRVQVARICQRLKADGLIKTSGRGIEIMDADKLSALCRM
jgi:CRP-like cAMP-binding protein